MAERGDFGGGTSSASTKLLHGGLRYLELGDFGLVKKALNERSVIFDSAPHLAWPMPFVIPRMRDARPEWQIRLALLLYDHRSEEHTSELQSLMRIPYAVFCLKTKQDKQNIHT